MINAMMWFDDDKKRSLEQKIDQAIKYYAIKYKQKPELVLINPAELKPGEQLPHPNGLSVEGLNIILPHHIWVGMN